MPSKKPLANPLALAVLAVLYERPRHPYEIAATMRTRGHHEVFRLNYGSLYTVVVTLQEAGLIEPRETLRDGRRPERTIYAITAQGRDAFLGRLREYLRTPAAEYPRFVAGLAFLGALPPEEAAALLEARIRLLEERLEQTRAGRQVVLSCGLPRLFLVEQELSLALGEAEVDWVRALVSDIRSGALVWPHEQALRALLAGPPEPVAADPSIPQPDPALHASTEIPTP